MTNRSRFQLWGRFLPAVVMIAVSARGAAWASPTAERFLGHVKFLASDDLEGRGVGQPGIDTAADYIAAQFKELGLEPAGDDGTYFQTFELAVRRSLSGEGRLAFSGDKEEWKLQTDFIPFSFSSDDEFSGPVVFCGYGIVNTDKKHDDFGDLDLTGKVALILRGEPDAWADDEGGPTQHATFRNKIYNARDAGAAAVLIVNKAPAEGETDELARFTGDRPEAYGLPAIHITRDVAAEVLARAHAPTLKELETGLDKGEFVSQPLAHLTVNGRAGLRTDEAPVRNVVARLPGTGPLADECIVVGAHYDHLGIREPMARRFKAGKLVEEQRAPEIHNGADDNASGVAGLIEIAGAFANGPKPKRSIVFIAFTAEESGLHGSNHYIDHPACPIEKTRAMLNMDMIGRMESGADRVLVFGAKTGKGNEEIVADLAKKAGLAYESSADGGGRSDHAPFLRKSVPAMHFFTGIHSDYHKPSDDVGLINAEGGAKVAGLVYEVAAALADREVPAEFVAIKMGRTPSAEAGSTPSYRVVMGLAPGYADDGKPGMNVEYVTDDGPADLAGMKGGDRIIRISDKPVGNIYDYMAATRNNKPGDTVTVVVLRDGKEVTLNVTLAGAR